MSDEDEGSGVSIAVSVDGAKAEVSNRALARIGEAAAWLFPKRAARVQITRALAQRVAEKIRSGESLDESERMFGALMFEKHARAIVNQTAAAERVRAILPEIEDRMQSLPPTSDRGTTADFVARVLARKSSGPGWLNSV